MTFSVNLRRLRRDRGLNQGQVAEICGLKPSLIAKLEKEGSNPELKTIYSLMAGLGCSANTLLLGEDYKFNLDESLKAAFERANGLPDKEKSAIVDMIDKYCIAEGMAKIYEENSKTFLGITKMSGPIDKAVK